MNMTSEEAFEYIQNNNLEYDMFDALLFNNLDFFFMPLLEPILKEDTPRAFYISTKNDFNVLSSDYCNLTFSIEDLRNTAPRMLYHPEHLIGYQMKFQNQIVGQIKYYKKSDGAKYIRRNAIREFLDCFEGDKKTALTIDYINHIIEVAKQIRDTYKSKTDAVAQIVDVDILFDEAYLQYIKSEETREGKSLLRNYINRLIDTQFDLAMGRCSLLKPEVYYVGNYKPDGLWYCCDVIYPKEIYTNLDNTISIIDPRDTIPNILFELSIRLKAQILKIATGYLYDSGLELLEPVLNTVSNANGKIDFYVGSLQSYPNETTKFNRATAKLVNEYLGSKRIDNIFTYSNKFLHGKHYYLANDEEAYVIIGSSNVTYSAYYENYEFNIIHHIKRSEDAFLPWFAVLEGGSRRIDHLDEEVFERNIIQDENGKTKGSHIREKLTTEEQRRRYSLLESYGPSQIYEYCFKSAKGFKPFKDYSVFQFEEKGIFVLEAFDFGNACYVLKGDSLDRIKKELNHKTKADIQRSDCYLTHIEHQAEFEIIIHDVLSR